MVLTHLVVPTRVLLVPPAAASPPPARLSFAHRLAAACPPSVPRPPSDPGDL